MLGSAVKTSIGTRFILGSGKRALYKNALLPSQNTPKFTNICQQCRLSSYFTSLSQFSSRKSIQQQQQISRSYSVNATVVKKPPSSSSSSSNSRIPRAKKAVLTLTQAAVNQLKALQTPDGDPRILRVGVKNRGCSGLTYTLDYVTKKERFDEVVVQDDVTVLVDSKALFSIIGSEMDYVQDQLSSSFVFRNPNVKESCGCGQSFMV